MNLHSEGMEGKLSRVRGSGGETLQLTTNNTYDNIENVVRECRNDKQFKEFE